MLAYLYYSNGAPINGRYYSGPGRFEIKQAEVRLERYINLGETRIIHMGHGHFQNFTCVAVDNNHALLRCTY